MAYTFTHSATSSLGFSDFLNLFATAAYGGSITQQDTTTYQVDRSGRSYVFEGTAFEYTVVNGQSLLTGGTLSTLTILEAGSNVGTISNLSINNLDLTNAFLAELDGSDPFALEAMFLQTDWVFQGTDGVQVLTADQTSAEGYAIPPSGDDIAYLLGGDDIFDLGAGNDTLFGGDGRDQLFGGSGNDRVSGGAHRDKLYGGEGDDLLKGGSWGDSLYGGEGDDVLKGQKGHDLMYGGNGDDSLYGGNKNDQMYGDAGDDYLKGGSGSDTLFGGEGDDVLKGGSGADVFVFDTSSGDDLIEDYYVSQDTLRILGTNGITVTTVGNQVLVTHDGGVISLDGVDISTTADELAFLNTIDIL
jgi:Ca2+-binding RTX toxin-like protein